jgi:nitronate monooxygenase
VPSGKETVITVMDATNARRASICKSDDDEPVTRLQTPLCELLGIRIPILLAGMAAGPCTPELVAAVSCAGGLGVFGATGMTTTALERDIERARELGATAIGVNVQITHPNAPRTDPATLANALVDVRRALDLPSPPPAATPHPPAASARELIDAALTAGATVVTTGLGDPAEIRDLAAARGAPVLAMVASVADARRARASGADAIIAQGAEAGGHRATFDVPADGRVPLVGTLALVPRVVDAVDVPVVASGGIMDGRGLAAVLALGAQGASLGTRFLLATESAAAPIYRATLAGLPETATVVTDAVTGRPARWVRNALIDRLDAGPGHVGWGPQRRALEDIRTAAAARGVSEYLPMLAGQGAGMAREQAAAAIVDEIADEAVAVMTRLGDLAR